jgi:hypothetical protein
MTDKNRVPPEPSFTFDADGFVVKNRGGRPRKDGTRADNATTLKEMGISKRDAARMRFYASFPKEVFEDALAAWGADFSARKPKRTLESYLPDRKANSQHQREARANIARIVSSARLIVKACEFDSSDLGIGLRRMAELTIAMWT